MRLLSNPLGTMKALLGAAVLGLTATTIQAQGLAPQAAPVSQGIPSACVPCPGYGPSTGGAYNPGGTNNTGMGTGNAGDSSGEGSDFRSLTSGAGYSSSTAVGYIDSAIPMTQLRLRFDAAFDDNVPDRAAFLYAKCGCFSGAPGPGPNPNARVNYQEVSANMEYAINERFSSFMEVPLRFLEQTSVPLAQPGNNGSTGGISDIDFGFKYAALMDPCQVGTFQLRTYAPTGDPHEGLGNNLWVLEPAFLYYRRLSDKWVLEAELRDWIPVGTTDDFAGNVLRYGVGLSYEMYKGPSFRITPVAELVGWTVLSGKELDLNSPTFERNSAGDEIVNAKFGVRVGLGDGVSPGLLNHSDFYVGYGRALTTEVWYENIVRVEWRVKF